MRTGQARLLVLSVLFLFVSTVAWAGIGSSDLAITKDDGASVSAIGGSVVYTIVGTNNGPDDIFGATVTDNFPSVLTCTWTCAASSGSSCTGSGSGNISDTVTLLENGTVTYTATCNISGGASPGILSNTASISSPATDIDSSNNMATDINNLWPAADLQITKSDGVTSAAPGTSITYTIVASNAGPQTSFNASVSDTFPASLTCTWTCAASIGSSCTGAGSGNISDSVSLLSGGTATYTAVCAIPATATGTLSNTATITGSVVDPDTSNNSDTDSNTVLTPETDFSITKADSVDPVVPGQSLTYTMTVTNNGPTVSTGGTVTDVLPAGTSFSSSSDCTESGGTVTCAIGALGVGASEMVSFTVTVAPGQTAALSNTASVAANETDPTSGNNSATQGTAVSPEADLSITKADSVDPVLAGNALTYTMTVTNNGPSASTGGTVTDVLPAGTAFSSSSDCTESGGTVTCAIGALSVGASEMVSFTVTVDSDRTAALSNTASIAGNETDPTSSNDSATEATAVGVETDLSITKADSVDPVNAGDPLTYTLTVTNNGPSDSTGATVTDVLPAGTTFSSSSDCTESGGTVTCAIGALASGASEMVSFTVTVDSDRTNALSNTATVAANETDPTSSNDSATEATAVGVETDLSIAKADSVDPVDAGGSLTYTLTVTNNGPSDSTGGTVTDVLPSGTTFSSSSDCTESGGTVTCAIGALASGASEMVSFVVTVDAGQTAPLSNTATVAANETDSTSGNDSATEATSINIETDLSISKADSVDPVLAGNSLTYTLTVTNNGPADSSGATVTDVLPAGTTFSSSSDCSESGGTVTCAVGAMANGASEMVAFTVTVDSDQTAALSNTATVAANEVDSTSGNDSATEGTTVGTEADLSITKVDSADPVDVDTAFSYTITVSNAGPSDAAGVVVADTLPTGVTLVDTSGCAEDPTGIPSCTLGTVPAGGMASFQVNVTAPSTEGAITNTATVSASTTDPNSANDSASQETTITRDPTADLSITKDDGLTAATPGASVTYTIVASNAGPDDVTGATVTDTFPAELTCTWTCVASAGSTCTAAGSGDIADTVDLLNGGSVTYTAECDIDPSASGDLTNTATVASSLIDPDTSDNSATDVDTLEPTADLSVTSITMPNPADLGESVTIEVTVSNAGPSDTTGVILTSTLPDGLTFVATSGCVEDPNGVPTCSLGDLAAGASATVFIDAVASAEGSSSGTLSVESDLTDPDDSNDTTVATVNVGSILEIPVMDPLGMAILVLLLTGAAYGILRRRNVG